MDPVRFAVEGFDLTIDVRHMDPVRFAVVQGFDLTEVQQLVSELSIETLDISILPVPGSM